MRLYETAFLIAPNLPEEETEKLIKQMAGLVSKKKGKMINVDKWGKKELAYPISKFEQAFYVFFLYEGEPEIPTELERRFKQDESILRYLTVKKVEKERPRKKKKKSRPEKTARKVKIEKTEKEEKPAKEKEQPVKSRDEEKAKPVQETKEKEE